MKSFTTILVILFAFGCLNANAQWEKSESDNQRPDNLRLNKNLSAGTELRKASSHYYIGLGTVAGGIFMMSAGVAAESDEAITLGLIAFVVGEVFMIEAWSHIGKAGKLMQRQSVSIRVKGNGLGLAYHF